jgi:hypothetical protein
MVTTGQATLQSAAIAHRSPRCRMPGSRRARAIGAPVPGARRRCGRVSRPRCLRLHHHLEVSIGPESIAGLDRRTRSAISRQERAGDDHPPTTVLPAPKMRFCPATEPARLSADQRQEPAQMGERPSRCMARVAMAKAKGDGVRSAGRGLSQGGARRQPP